MNVVVDASSSQTLVAAADSCYGVDAAIRTTTTDEDDDDDENDHDTLSNVSSTGFSDDDEDDNDDVYSYNDDDKKNHYLPHDMTTLTRCPSNETANSSGSNNGKPPLSPKKRRTLNKPSPLFVRVSPSSLPSEINHNHRNNNPTTTKVIKSNNTDTTKDKQHSRTVVANCERKCLQLARSRNTVGIKSIEEKREIASCERTCLQLARSFGYLSAVLALQDEKEVEIDNSDNHGRQPKHHVSSLNNCIMCSNEECNEQNDNEGEEIFDEKKENNNNLFQLVYADDEVIFVVSDEEEEKEKDYYYDENDTLHPTSNNDNVLVVPTKSEETNDQVVVSVAALSKTNNGSEETYHDDNDKIIPIIKRNDSNCSSMLRGCQFVPSNSSVVSHCSSSSSSSVDDETTASACSAPPSIVVVTATTDETQDTNHAKRTTSQDKHLNHIKNKKHLIVKSTKEKLIERCHDNKEEAKPTRQEQQATVNSVTAPSLERRRRQQGSRCISSNSHDGRHEQNRCCSSTSSPDSADIVVNTDGRSSPRSPTSVIITTKLVVPSSSSSKKKQSAEDHSNTNDSTAAATNVAAPVTVAEDPSITTRTSSENKTLKSFVVSETSDNDQRQKKRPDSSKLHRFASSSSSSLWDSFHQLQTKTDCRRDRRLAYDFRQLMDNHSYHGTMSSPCTTSSMTYSHKRCSKDQTLRRQTSSSMETDVVCNNNYHSKRSSFLDIVDLDDVEEPIKKTLNHADRRRSSVISSDSTSSGVEPSLAPPSLCEGEDGREALRDDDDVDDDDDDQSQRSSSSSSSSSTSSLVERPLLLGKETASTKHQNCDNHKNNMMISKRRQYGTSSYMERLWNHTQLHKTMKTNTKKTNNTDKAGHGISKSNIPITSYHSTGGFSLSSTGSDSKTKRGLLLSKSLHGGGSSRTIGTNSCSTTNGTTNAVVPAPYNKKKVDVSPTTLATIHFGSDECYNLVINDHDEGTKSFKWKYK